MEGQDGLDARIGRADSVRRVFEELPVILGAVQGAEHRYIASNAAHRSLLKSTDFIGKTMLEVNPEWRGNEVQQLMDLAFRTGTVQRIREWHIQILDPADGELRDAYVNATLVPRRDATGAIEGINSFTFDVTDLVQARQQAEARALLAEERVLRTSEDVAQLQRALLPPGLPVLPDVDVAAAYLLAQEAAAAGGDWYDAFRCPDGRIALVVGDVVGNGVVATAIMGQLRAVLHERLAAGESLTDSLAALDRMSAGIPGARSSTLCAVLLDPATGFIEYCTAGHQPPMLLSAEGASHHLPASGGAPLGTEDGSRQPAESWVPVSGSLVLYSDGLLERPGREPAVSLKEIEVMGAEILQSNGASGSADATPAQRIASGLIELLVKGTGYGDDITVLACFRQQSPSTLQLSAPAQAQTVPLMRNALREWLLECAVPGPMQPLLLHTGGELVSNAVLHAYRGMPPSCALAPDAVRLRAELTGGGVLELDVSDSGQWSEPNLKKHRVHGLDMASDLMDELRISHDDAGTCACARLTLTRAARTFDNARQPLAAQRPLPGGSTLLIMRHPGENEMRLVLDGPINITTTEALQQEFQRAMFHQPKALEIDLSRVTLLSSAGVASLHRMRQECESQDVDLRLIAPEGTTPAFVLDLVRLPRAPAPLQAGG